MIAIQVSVGRRLESASNACNSLISVHKFDIARPTQMYAAVVHSCQACPSAKDQREDSPGPLLFE
jgi:hypothetical protein